MKFLQVPTTYSAGKAGAVRALAPTSTRPVFGWRSFQAAAAPALPKVSDLRHKRLVSSGRAALYQALKLLPPLPGGEVLIPSYHCPTMVAAPVMLGYRPRYYAINADGLPDIASLGSGAGVAAIVVAHFFGRPQSLAAVRQWCDAEGVALIEDCAHCYFGQAGERPVGAWGDYAIASLTKFLPVPEAGLLASATRPLPDLGLSSAPILAQLKGVLDLFERACTAGTLPGIQWLLRPLFALKSRLRRPAGAQAASLQTADPLLAQADMQRVGQRALAASARLLPFLPLGRTVLRRQAHARRFRLGFAQAAGARPLFDEDDVSSAVPYVFPLWIASACAANRVYQGLRARGHAVFRWDSLWPGTPQLAADEGPRWSSQVLQLLCHQDLTDAQIDAAIACALGLLKGDGSSALPRSLSQAQPALAWQRLPALALADETWRGHWDRLNAGRGRVAILDARAVCAALAAFANNKHVALHAASEAGEIVAMMLLVPQGRLRLTTFQPSQLPLGAWVAAPHLSASLLAASLLRGIPWRLALSITQIDPLYAPRESDSAAVRHDDYITTPWLDIAGDFEEYWDSRGKNLRQNLRKQRRRLASEGIATRMRRIVDPDEMADALRRYAALEASGWKAQAGTHVVADEAQGRFYEQLFEEAARHGEARIYEYLFNDQTVAMNLGLLRAKKLIVLKTAYDANVDKAISPASLLREEELREFFATGEVRRIEYYGRAMEWHGRLTGETRILHHLSCYRWPLLRQWADRRRGGTPQAAGVAGEPVR